MISPVHDASQETKVRNREEIFVGTHCYLQVHPHTLARSFRRSIASCFRLFSSHRVLVGLFQKIVLDLKRTMFAIAVMEGETR